MFFYSISMFFLVVTCCYRVVPSVAKHTLPSVPHCFARVRSPAGSAAALAALGPTKRLRLRDGGCEGVNGGLRWEMGQKQFGLRLCWAP